MPLHPTDKPVGYLELSTGRYPVSQSQIRAEYPHTSFPSPFVPPVEYQWVFPTPQPTYDAITQGVREVAPALSTLNQYEQQWEVYDLSPEQVAENVARAEAQFIAAVTDATQARLDAFAKTRNYDGILSACTYATSTVPKFKNEGQYCVNARDTTWASVYQIMADVKAGKRPMPGSVAEVMDLLPGLSWPV